MISRTDTNHLLNKHNRFGQNALYLAAKFGNMNIVRFLIGEKADPHLTSKVNPKVFVDFTK